MCPQSGKMKSVDTENRVVDASSGGVAGRTNWVKAVNHVGMN